ncbi:septum formation protein Maf [Acholeplasma equirhinis]|uniref:Maf family protein n=1 Tax=Acholeplasma equirhinis TaxID=555393 RepID=UPI00197AF191|nr:nucleoside triphosphate pyrophosphatase [Acholeplasma equirhinis]MBN3491009.1 septum formation protein Maf [Acholeplasma equirhinis]
MLILGSTSARRKEIIEKLNIPFKVVSPNFNEDELDINLDPLVYVQTNALNKALSLKEVFPNDTILTADTIVVFEGEILNKPLDEADAYLMLKKLANNEHIVYTACTLIKDGKVEQFYDKAIVYFKHYSDVEILDYINTGEPMDKAGSYGIQGHGAKLIDKYEGSFYTIMGLPLDMVKEKLGL